MAVPNDLLADVQNQAREILRSFLALFVVLLLLQIDYIIEVRQTNENNFASILEDDGVPKYRILTSKMEATFYRIFLNIHGEGVDIR